MGLVYPEVEKNKARFFDELEKEEEKFSTALENGTKILEKKLQFLGQSSVKQLNAKGAFDLFQS